MVPRVAFLSACCLAAWQAPAWVQPFCGGLQRQGPQAWRGAVAGARGRLRPLRASFEEFSKKELLKSLRSFGFRQSEWKILEKADLINVLKDLRLSPEMLMGSKVAGKRFTEKAAREKAKKERCGKWGALSKSQLRKAVGMLGEGLQPKQWSKQKLVDELSGMGVGPEDVLMILGDVGSAEPAQKAKKPKAKEPKAKEPSSKKKTRRRGPGPRGPRGGEGGEMSSFSVEQLREALFALGSGMSTFQWPKSRLIETLSMFQVDASDVAELLGAVRPEGRPEGRPRRRRGRRSRSSDSDDSDDDTEFDDEFSPPEEWGADPWLQDADGEPFDTPWGKTSGAWRYGTADNPSGSSRRERKRRAREERQSFERAAEEQWLRDFADFPFHGAAQQEPSSSSAPSAGAAEGSLSPDDAAMWRALREGWSAKAMTRQRAMSLLGVTRTPTAETLRKARRKLVLHWHPDRNPDNPHASTALGLAMAACEALTG